MRYIVGLALVAGCGTPPPLDEPRVDSGFTTPSSSASAACLSGDLGLEIGNTETGFEPVTTGADVTMVHGPQGGWHVWTSVQLTNAEPQVSLQPRVTVPDLGGLQVSGLQSPAFVALVNYVPSACTGQFFGMRSYLDTDTEIATGETALDDLCAGGYAPACAGALPYICSIAGHTLDFEVEAVDIVDGRVGTAKVQVVAALDPVDVPNCP